MGRTLPSATQVFDAEAARWGKFRRALRREDQALFDEVFREARTHVAAMAYASSPAPMEAVLLAMLLEARRGTRELRERVARLEEASASEPTAERRAVPGAERVLGAPAWPR